MKYKIKKKILEKAKKSKRCSSENERVENQNQSNFDPHPQLAPSDQN